MEYAKGTKASKGGKYIGGCICAKTGEGKGPKC